MKIQANINDSSMLEIRNVPTGLILYAVRQWLPCQKYAKNTGMFKNTNTFIKAIAVWLILKNETTSGNIKQYRTQLLQLASKCKMSVRTLEKYIVWLEKEELLHTEEKNLMLQPYRVLRKYGIDITKREETIFYDTKDNTELAEIIIAIALKKMKEKWMQMYWDKLNKNPDKYKVLYDLLIDFKADASRLKEPGYFRECHLELLLQSFNEEKPGQSFAYDLLHKELQANPDLNCKGSTYARKMGYSVCEKKNAVTKKDESSSMGFNHLKHRLARKGLIYIEKDHIEGMARARKDEKIFHHRWLRELKHTIWFRCDQITINTEKFFRDGKVPKLQNFFVQKTAA